MCSVRGSRGCCFPRDLRGVRSDRNLTTARETREMSDHRADQIVMTIHAGPEAPSEARRAVEDVLEGNGRLDDALLVTSELVSNTVLHSGIDDGEPIRLVVSRRSGRIRIGMSHARAGD